MACSHLFSFLICKGKNCIDCYRQLSQVEWP